MTENNAIDDNPDISKELEAALKKADEYKKGWQRAVADFENYKRRDQELHSELMAFGEEKVIARIVDTLEDLNRVLTHTPNNPDLKEWKKGVEGVRQRFHDALHDLGVEKVKTEGENFNPDFHEAVAQVEGVEDNVVAEEVAPGYKRRDKVMKPAKVKVFKKSNS